MTDAGSEPTTVNGLELLLGEGAAQPQPVTAVAAPATQPLDDACDPADPRSHAGLAGRGRRRGGVQAAAQSPPPTANTVVTQSFPPPDSGATAPRLSPVRWKCCATRRKARFPWRPSSMSPSTSPWCRSNTLDALAAEDVPVKATPDLPGVWKWLGTQTLSL